MQISLKTFNLTEIVLFKNNIYLAFNQRGFRILKQ